MSGFEVRDLTCERNNSPLGIDEAKPRLGWKLAGDRPGLRQTAYRIRVGTDKGKHDLWDSGRIEAATSVDVEYEGKGVASRQRVWWHVEIWDEIGNRAESEPSAWEVGLLERRDWRARWIQGPLAGGPRTSSPCPFIRRDFALRGAVRKARLYATALGLYEARINGKRVSGDLLSPGWTDFEKRVRFQTYDVTDMLADGDNAIGFVLGDGWFCGHVSNLSRQLYGDRPRLLAQLEVELENGEGIEIVSDESWKLSYGPILESDLIQGETYDARREFPGWDLPRFEDALWPGAMPAPDYAGRIVAQSSPPIRALRQVRPIAVEKRPAWPTPKWIFDMGENMVGHVRLKTRGKAGETVVLRHGERLDESGGLYTPNLRGAKQTDAYTFGEAEEADWEPKFAFHGFQFVEVSGLTAEPDLNSMVGVVCASDLHPTGEFSCSEPLIDKLHANTMRGWRGNSLDVPTDCPQRDERLGWTGDAQVFCPTACYLTDAANFFEKYVQDLEDSQSSNGMIPMVAPNPPGMEPDGGPAWADAFVVVPYTVWKLTGDRRILERHYAALKRFWEQQKAACLNGLRCLPGYAGFRGFGDWLSIQADTPYEVIGTAYFIKISGLMVEIARELGQSKDAARFEASRMASAEAFRARFVTPDGLVFPGTQTSYVLSLGLDLLTPQQLDGAVEALIQDIERREQRLSTGFVGSKELPIELARAGRSDVAFLLLEQRRWPSWLYAVTLGATTIWERWDGWTSEKGFQDPGMNSFNHYAYGAVCEWLHTFVAGIEPLEPGFKRIRFTAGHGGSLTWAKSKLETPYGDAKMEWEVKEDKLAVRACVPPNATGLLAQPEVFGKLTSGKVDLGSLEPGEHRFVFERLDPNSPGRSKK